MGFVIFITGISLAISLLILWYSNTILDKEIQNNKKNIEMLKNKLNSHFEIKF